MHNFSLTSAQLTGILSIADDAIICADAKQRILLFNQGAERIFGWQADEIIGQDLTVLLPLRFRQGHHAHVSQFGAANVQARQMSERRGISAVRRDGSEFQAEASISKLESDSGMIYTVILRDITVRKAHERELELAKEAAEAAMLAKSMFLANMSHEIRTPLNAVIGMTSLLLNTDIDDEQRDYASTIRASGEVLLTIVNDILDYSKIDVGKLEIERASFDLRRCIEDSMDLLASSASEKNLNLAYFMDESVPAALVSDVTRLRQILVNLLSNSIKFTHHGEVVVSVSATAMDDQMYEFSFTVKDTGIGIPDERIPDLFQSFTQVDASTTRKYGGTGLGLTIARSLAEVMGGRMWVESQVGVGSSFFFTIVAEASGVSFAHNVLQERSSALLGKRLLIVDDNATNRRILVKQALLWGMVPSAAASAVEAMDFVRHGHAFDAAILDMSMPEVDGLGLAREIRKFRGPDALPLIMLTSMAQRPREAMLSQLQITAFLKKPIKPAALFDVLSQAMKIGPRVATTPTPGEHDARPGDTHPLAILVAEDNAVNQKVLQQLLAHLGYRADVVGNGVEALDALERQDYDVVLMDVQMPEMDGLEATRRLRQRFGHDQAPRVIAMTANAMPGDRERCLAAGMDAYVAKPIELLELRAVLLAQVAPPAPSAIAIIDAADIIDHRRIAQLRGLPGERGPSLLAELITLFLDDAPQHLETLRAALERADTAALAAAAHRFLSGIDNLGVLRMSSHCMALERLARNDDLAAAGPELAGLQREFDMARPHLLSMMAMA